MEQDYIKPSRLLIALMDSIEEPVCLIDNHGNYLLNENAEKLKKSGLDIDYLTKQLKINSTKKVCFDGIEYCIEKKDINHGTNSFICKFTKSDDAIYRLTESSKKLKKVLSAF